MLLIPCCAPLCLKTARSPHLFSDSFMMLLCAILSKTLRVLDKEYMSWATKSLSARKPGSNIVRMMSCSTLTHLSDGIP